MSRKNIGLKKMMVSILAVSVAVAGGGYQKASADRKPALNVQKLTLTVGQTKKLKVVNCKKKVTWRSTNAKLAAVDKNGLVKAKKKGNVKIVAKAGKKKYVCRVTVKSKKPASSAVTNAPAATPENTAEPTLAPLPTVRPVETPDADWETGKLSGTEEDYNKYFALKLSQYTRKQEGTILGSFDSVTYQSKVVGAEREAYVYLPPAYDKNKKYPVMYMIHGIGCDRTQWYSMSLNNILSNMICSGETAPFIAVLPSVIPKDGLTKNSLSQENIAAFTMFEEEFVKDLEPYILANYNVSSDRKDTGVCGLSMGGMEALHLGFTLKDHFNYIGSFSAAPTLNQEILTLDGWSTKPEVVLLCSGSAEDTVGQNPNNYHAALEQNKVDHIWYLFPKGRHETRVWQSGLINMLKRSFR